MMKTKLLNRVVELIDDMELSMRYVEQESNITTGYISKARALKRSISANRLESIYKTLKKETVRPINPEWLLTGIGNKYLDYKNDDTILHRVKEEEESDYRFTNKLLASLDNKIVQKKLIQIMTQ